MMIYTRNIWGKESLRKVWNLNHFEEIRISTDDRNRIAEITGTNLNNNATFLLAYKNSQFAILDINTIKFLELLMDDIIATMSEDKKVYDINKYYINVENNLSLFNKSSFDVWLEEQLKKNRKAKPEILKFIWNFVTHDKISESFKVIEHQFTTGYCYHFALIMKNMFGGKIVWHKGHSHILWQDRNKVIYDIRGVYCDYRTYEIVPVSELGDDIEGYLHK